MTKRSECGRLTEGVDHGMIAIGVERIAAIVAGDRDRYTTLG
jgi:hypothetical protein